MGRCRGINDRLRSERYAEQFGDPATDSCRKSRSWRVSVTPRAACAAIDLQSTRSCDTTVARDTRTLGVID